MLELKLAGNDVTNGNVAVAWCVDQETLKYLSDKKVADPQVVIVVAPVNGYHIRREYRKVVPLKDLMTYLEFRSSGENRIWAFISHQSKKKARGNFLAKSEGEYATTILNEDGDDWSYIFPPSYVSSPDRVSMTTVHRPEVPAPTLTVNVPTGVFAKEPSKWEKTWVNHWFHAKAVDQCDFRRRRLLAYTVQPIVMLLDILVARALLSLIAFMWLSRGLSLSYFLHPLTYSLLDTVDVLKGGTWTVPTLPEDERSRDPDITFSYVIRKLWKTPLMPVVLIPLLLILHFHVVLWVLGITGGVVLGVALAFVIASGAFSALWEKIQEWTGSDGEVTPWYLEQDEMDTITCNPSFQNRTSVSSLPAKHRTIYLRFQDLKSRVCRPFST